MFNSAKQSHFSLNIECLAHDLQALVFSGREAISQPFAFAPGGIGIHGLTYRVAQGESGFPHLKEKSNRC